MFAKLPPLIEKTASEAEAKRRKTNRELTEACAGVSLGGYARYGTGRNETVSLVKGQRKGTKGWKIVPKFISIKDQDQQHV